MEAHISLLQDFVKTPKSLIDTPATIKMEDLCSEQTMLSTPQQTSNTPSTSTLNFSAETPRPSESSSSSKGTKKRKSWGQVLPEPKTNLPPRKRAKTADEKEQRRIERVKRNRLAAHNSRERKRQEVDALQAQKQALEDRVRAMEAELTAYRTLFPQANVPQAAPLREEAPFQGISILDSYNDNIYNDLENENDNENENEHENEKSTVAPSQRSFESPDSLLSTLDSPVDTAPSTPGNEMMHPESDQTQHSAAMLWDLQCRSDISNSIISTPSFQAALTTIILFNIRILLMTAASTIYSTSPSFRRVVTAWLAARNLSSTPASTARRHTPSLATQTTFWSRLMQASSICSPAQARLLQSATHQALQRRAASSKQLQSSTGSAKFGVETTGCDGSRRVHNRRTSRGRILRMTCNNSSLARDIKRRCRIIIRRSFLESGRQKQP